MNETENKKVALLTVTLGYFLTPFMSSSLTVALPSIGEEFSVDAVFLGWIITAYLLTAAMFLVPFGKIADMYGRKKIFACGLLVFLIFSLLTALSTSLYTLICFRALQGVGGGMIFGSGLALLTSVFPENERGRALGINVAVVYLGQTIGPFVGGMLTQHLGWRSIFYINMVFCLIALSFVLWKLQGEWAELKGETFNFVNSVLYSVSILVMLCGMSLIPEIVSIWLLTMGALGFFFFLWRETRVKNPIIDINLFKSNRVFAFSNLATFINFSATYAVVFLISLYLQYIHLLSPQSAGLVLVSNSIVQIIFSPIAGRLSDSIEPRILSSVGMGLTTAALFFLTFVSSRTSIVYIVAFLIILGFGIGFFSSPNTNAVMSSVEKKFYGVSSASLGTMRLAGQLFSMAIVMLVFALTIGKVEITPQYHGAFLSGLKIIFATFTALCFSGIFASLARGPSVSNPSQCNVE